MKNKPVLPAIVLLIMLNSITSADVVLYNAALGTTPGEQGWISVIGGANEAVSGGLLNLNTSADQDEQAGYFSESPFNGALEHPNMPVLDLTPGFTVRFDLEIVSETHAARDDNGDGKDDRAGFSLITISEDLRGLELAFFENRVWAYADASEGASSLFTQAEGVDFDTTELTTYDLVFDPTGYELFASGESILSGDLRNYNPSGVPVLFDPYDNPSFLFFGDDTSSASSHSRIGTVQVLAAVPEPASTLMLILAGSVAGIVRRKPKSVNSHASNG